MKKIISLKFIALLLMFLLLTSNSYMLAEKLKDEDIYSSSAVAVDATNGTVLFAKDAEKRVYPASTTKILTAILTLENLELNSPVTASQNAIYSTPYGSSSIYLKVGEVMTVKNLLYGLLVKSGNDAANVLAEAVAGDLDKFTDMMNEKALEIGCTNTHFTNAHGFHDDDHYTTALDMAKLMNYALKNDTFREIIKTKEITLSATNKTAESRLLISTNKMLNKAYPNMYYEYIIGGKTGYTDEAQGTFVGLLEKDDKSIIVAVFDSPQDINSNEGRFLDTIRISDFIFDDFSKSTVLDKTKISFNITDKNLKKQYTVSLKSDVESLSDNPLYRVSYKIDTENIADILSENDKVGTSLITAKNGNDDFYLSSSYDLQVTSVSDYKYLSLKENLLKIIIILAIVLVILILMYKRLTKKSKKKRNKTRNKI